MPHLPAANNGGQWARVRGPCARPNPAAEAEAEPEAEAESRLGLGLGPRLLRAKSSNPHINRVLTDSGTCSLQMEYSAQSKALRHGLAFVEANPRPQCRAHATRFGQRRLRFACSNRTQPVARQRSSVQPVATGAVRNGIDRAKVALGCNIVRVVATHCAALLRHTCVALRQMSRRAAVVAQMWAGDGLGCGADVGWGWTLLQWCKGGQGIDSVQLLMWVGGGVCAEVGSCEPSPVVSNEHNPKTQVRAYRGETVPSCAALRTNCAAHTLRCNGCRCVQLPVERCSGAVHCCRLRCDATSSALSGWAHSRAAQGVL
jgi:hypothetical protein